MNCHACDQPISAARLAAVPSAHYCVVCQSMRDLTPQEILGDDVVARVLVVQSEQDGAEFRVGGDSFAGKGLL